MDPRGLEARRVRLAPKNGCRMVLMTGTSLRQERTALLMQRALGRRLAAWFRVSGSCGSDGPPGRGDLLDGVRRLAAAPGRLRRLPGYCLRRLARHRRKRSWNPEAVEERMFGEELRPLRESAHLRPVPAEDVNSPEVVERMAELSPYLLVVLCGGRPGQPLLREVCGLSIRVHEGWCPEYRGANAVEWALYHRDIRRIGSTVHIIREGPNRGPILRRASACLTAFDTAPSCRARVAALGAAILRDAVEEILQEDEITVYDQPAGAGRTSRPADMTEWIRQAIHRDLGKGMLARELQRQRSF